MPEFEAHESYVMPGLVVGPTRGMSPSSTVGRMSAFFVWLHSAQWRRSLQTPKKRPLCWATSGPHEGHKGHEIVRNDVTQRERSKGFTRGRFPW